MFRKAFIDVYFLGVSNRKGCVHSQPQKHFYLSFCFHFFILIGAMSEGALERLR